MQRRVAVARDRLQALHEVDLLSLGRQLERVPRELRGADVHLRVQREEARLELDRKMSEYWPGARTGGLLRTSGLSGRRTKPWCATDGRMR